MLVVFHFLNCQPGCLRVSCASAQSPIQSNAANCTLISQRAPGVHVRASHTTHPDASCAARRTSTSCRRRRCCCSQVVAFVKGTRSQPQCGFSYKMLQILNDSRTDYEVVNVLDDFHNPGLREAIKQYSQWPTIPQLYVGGEFVGGSDIVEEMQASGDLGKVLSEATVPVAAGAAK